MDIKSIPQRWTELWSTNDTDEWVELFAPDGKYIDHAFQICRQGHKTLARHHQLWRTANPDFLMTIAPDSPVWWSPDVDEKTGHGKCSIRTINKGTNKADLPTVKATGKAFEFTGVVDMVFDGGKIKELQEWYTQKPFGQAVGVEGYHTVADLRL